MSVEGKPVIGLTGGVGAGKSLVAREFAGLGCRVIDADRIARESLEEPDVRAALTRRYGRSILDKRGRVDRARLGDRVFADPGERRWLEGLTHPRVRERRAALREQARTDPAVVAVVEDSPLLMEAGLARECDAVVFVDAPRSVRLERVRAERGWDEAELARREKNQLPLDTKRARADYLVDNTGGEGDCFHAARAVLSQVLQDHCQDSHR